MHLARSEATLRSIIMDHECMPCGATETPKTGMDRNQGWGVLDNPRFSVVKGEAIFILHLNNGNQDRRDTGNLCLRRETVAAC